MPLKSSNMTNKTGSVLAYSKFAWAFVCVFLNLLTQERMHEGMFSHTLLEKGDTVKIIQNGYTGQAVYLSDVASFMDSGMLYFSTEVPVQWCKSSPDPYFYLVDIGEGILVQ